MENEQSNSENSDSELVVDFIKSNNFRVAFADGFWGGVTPTDKVQIAFWNSREAIPRQMRFEIDDKGDLGDPVFDSRADIIHEVETSVLMDFETAKQLREWLNGLIEEVESEES